MGKRLSFLDLSSIHTILLKTLSLFLSIWLLIDQMLSDSQICNHVAFLRKSAALNEPSWVFRCPHVTQLRANIFRRHLNKIALKWAKVQNVKDRCLDLMSEDMNTNQLIRQQNILKIRAIKLNYIYSRYITQGQ